MTDHGHLSIPLDLDNGPQAFHIVGIGGAGMSAIASVLNKMGKTVSGSDLKESNVTERLRSQGISVTVPHDASCVTDAVEVVVVSTAIASANPEVMHAHSKSIPVLSRADMLSAICSHEKSIGIAGSHGKTTTTSMATAIARAADMNPSFMIGGDVNEIGTNAGYTPGSYLIVEADESDRTFLTLPLVGAVITNIENDHLENYGESFDNLKDSFASFAQSVDGPVVVCVDEENSRNVASVIRQHRDVITVGSRDADWTYVVTSQSRGGVCATLTSPDSEDVELELAVPGVHNVKNALCALVLMHTLGASMHDCVRGLASFGGVARRFQFRGETQGITFVDDYAHLPSEIDATLQAARHGSFRRVLAIFQPHRYSRTESLYQEFAQSLSTADVIGVCEIYSAGEQPRSGVSSALIVDELKKNNNDVKALRHIEDVVAFVRDNAQPGDLVLTLGAGDVTMYSDVIQDAFRGHDVMPHLHESL